MIWISVSVSGFILFKTFPLLDVSSTCYLQSIFTIYCSVLSEYQSKLGNVDANLLVPELT